MDYGFNEVRKKKAFYIQTVSTSNNTIRKKIKFINSGILLKKVVIDSKTNKAFETVYWNNGNVRYTNTYKEGKMNGTRTKFDWYGKKVTETNYVNGKVRGKQKTYNKNGELVSVGRYRYSKLNGKYIKYNLSDSSETISYYKNGLLNGSKVKISYNKTTLDSSNYINGKKNGVSYRYHKNGSLRDTIRYENGKKNGLSVEYFENGVFKDSLRYLDGKRNGTAIGYYQNGQLEYISKFSNGKRTGSRKNYYENGQIEKDESYEDGKLVSSKYYTETGKDTTYAIIEIVEKQPEFPGGVQNLFTFLSKNVKYPEQARQLGVSGKVYVEFVVEKDGSITDIKLIRGIGEGCDEEAMRAISKMPNWSPGIQAEKPVRVRFVLPVNFSLR